MSELAQPFKGKTLYKEFLKKHGEGIHHIGFSRPLPFEDELAEGKGMESSRFK